MKKSFKFLITVSLSTLLLAGCASSGKNSSSGMSTTDEAVARAMVKANGGQSAPASVSVFEKAYIKNPSDPVAATNFATALRQNDFTARAAAVLEPFAKKNNASSLVKSEYAAIQLQDGNFKVAESYARKAIGADKDNYEAWQYLGIALDAQEEHEEAETSFRTALDIWEGDPVPIMNNLALNLASQEHLDEAEEILLKAKSIAPKRRAVERNLRIVRALKESSSYTWKAKPAPTPGKKPR